MKHTLLEIKAGLPRPMRVRMKQRLRLASMIAVMLCSASMHAQLSNSDQTALTTYLENLSQGWDQPSVDAANAILNGSPQYAAQNWEGFFMGYFASHKFTDALENYLGYPVFYWFDDNLHRRLQTALQPVAQSQVSGVLQQYGAALGAYLSASTANREDLHSWLVFLWNLTQVGSDSIDRGTIYSFAKGLVSLYPDLFRADHDIDPAQEPYANWVRMQVTILLTDALPLTDARKADIAATVHLAGTKRQSLWGREGVFLHDNLFLDDSQADFLQTFFVNVPPAVLPKPLGISVADALGNSGDTALGTAAKALFNEFKIRIGDSSENGFPPDVAPYFCDGFALVTAHESNHNVEAHYIQKSALLTAREAALLQDAGSDPMNYLRSMFEPGFFVTSPQEFFASISNQYFANTALTFELGRLRFQAGRRQPLEQFLFFLDVYSAGTDQSRGYMMDTSAKITVYAVPMSRDSSQRTIDFVLGGKQYQVSYGEDGHVVGLQEVPLSLAPCASLRGCVTPVTPPPLAVIRR